MPKQTIAALVEGGKASAGPPLGPALGAIKAPVPKIIQAINEKTKAMAGIQVPIKIHIDPQTREFEIEVGSPPVAALIKKELGIPKGSGEPKKLRAGDLTEAQVKKVAMVKFGSDAQAFYNQVAGTARSMGVTIGQGAVTKEEIDRYNAQKAAEEAAAAEVQAAKAAAAGTPVAGATPAEGAKEAAPAGKAAPAAKAPAKSGKK